MLMPLLSVFLCLSRGTNFSFLTHACESERTSHHRQKKGDAAAAAAEEEEVKLPTLSLSLSPVRQSFW